ncbi:kelch repeat and BTB domain-containing protein 8-like isoform X2 [Hyperolius riggenbachi]|uniref:kelch repeat and BTB domain-containing protein 8-like isoform X2 n=1 Tax=Hyperolius riggenbachi TaxID=752182 RepID=UPI0035A301D7
MRSTNRHNLCLILRLHRPTMEKYRQSPSWCMDDDDAEFFSEDEGTRQCAVIQGLRDLYLTDALCDVTIVTATRRFLCHRVVLASVSPYFRAMFTTCMVESQQGEVSLLDVTASIIETILHFIYTGEAAVTLDNVEDLFTVSSRLQITAMQEQCSRFLIQRLNNDNCFWTYRLAFTHNHSRLLEMAMKYIGWHITSVSKKEDLIHLELSEIIKLLSSDKLMVSSELSVYHMALSWWKANSSGDSPLPVELRRVIRLQYMLPHEQEEVEKSGGWDIQKLTQFRLRQGMFENWIVFLDLCTGDEKEDYFFMDAYDPVSEEWNKLMPLKYVSHAECVAVGNYLYVTGGELEDLSSSKAFYVYDSMTNDWTELPSMMSPRMKHGFLSCKKKLYAVGGWNKDGILDSMECFDLSKHCWAELSKLPYPLLNFASAQLKGKLYIIGGQTIPEHGIKGLLIYDIAPEIWSLIPNNVCLIPNNVVRYGGAVAMDNKVFVIGYYSDRYVCGISDRYEGFTSGFNYTYARLTSHAYKCFVLDEKGCLCEDLEVPSLPKKVATASVARWRQRIYVFGGYTPQAFNKNVYYWTPGSSRWTKCIQGSLPPFHRRGNFSCAAIQVPLRKL